MVLEKISCFILLCSTLGMSGISLSSDNGHFYRQKQWNKTRAVEMETFCLKVAAGLFEQPASITTGSLSPRFH